MNSMFLFLSVWATQVAGKSEPNGALQPPVAFVETSQNDSPLFAYRYLQHIPETDLSSTTQVFVGQNTSVYVDTFHQLQSQWKIVDVNPYYVGSTLYYTSVWQKYPAYAWASFSNIQASDYQGVFNTWTGQGFRPLKVRCYPCGTSVCYTVIFEKSPAPGTGEWAANHGIPASQYQQHFDTMAAKYVLADICGCQDYGGQVYYATIWNKYQSYYGWLSWNALSVTDFQYKLGHWYNNKEYTLSHINLYRIGGAPYYATIWTRTPATNNYFLYYAVSKQLSYTLNWVHTGAQFLQFTAC